jgi:hypothetical protein
MEMPEEAHDGEIETVSEWEQALTPDTEPAESAPAVEDGPQAAESAGEVVGEESGSAAEATTDGVVDEAVLDWKEALEPDTEPAETVPDPSGDGVVVTAETAPVEDAPTDVAPEPELAAVQQEEPGDGVEDNAVEAWKEELISDTEAGEAPAVEAVERAQIAAAEAAETEQPSAAEAAEAVESDQAAAVQEATIAEADAVIASDEGVAAAAEPEAPVEAPSAPVLAADAIAATAMAAQPETEPEPEPEPEPSTVVVATELTWGFIDTEGRIHQKTTERFRGRVVARIHGGSGEPQIAELESNFGPIAKEVEILEGDVSSAKNKVAVLGRVKKLKSTIGRTEALGDFDDLVARLQALEAACEQEIEERRAAKEALIAQAEEIKDSTDWKKTGEAYKELFLQWKQVGATGREADDELWARFIGAREHFNTRRGEHYNQRQEQWEGNRLLKQDLIVRAHELSTSDQWRQTSDALRALFDEWKKIGSAGRQSDEELWQQFRGAQQHFYDRRNAAYDENRLRKEALCQRAEDLRESNDWNATVEEMKAMMADWKTIGATGKRDIDDALWNRFRGAQNAFFDRRYAETSAREQQERSQAHRKDEIAQAIEALAYASDAVAANEQAQELKAQFDALPPIRKDREDALLRRIRKAMGDIRVNAAAEGARRAVSWQGKLREALERSQDQIESLRQTIAGQEATLQDAQSQLAAAAGEAEKAELERQIQELYESISYNQAEIERLKGSMAEIEESVQV